MGEFGKTSLQYVGTRETGREQLSRSLFLQENEEKKKKIECN
jgi:hypothetical protein